MNHTITKVLKAVLVVTMMSLTGSHALAQVKVNGSVFGGGNEADVQVNTTVNISKGTVEGNVYGGGNLGDVGNITKNTTDYNYSWKQSDGSTANAAGNNDISGTNNNTGVSSVNITGSAVVIGPEGTSDENHGNVFGGGKGADDTFWCEKGMVFATNVSISAGTVKGVVFGGGEIGRVEDDTKVTIGEGISEPNIIGDVFGAGKGQATHGYSALVRGNSKVTVLAKAKVQKSVYGGGEIATVGRYVVVNGVPTEPNGGGDCTVIIQDDAAITGNVVGAGKGVDPATYQPSGEDRSKRMMVYDPERYTGEPSSSTWQFIKTYDGSYEGTKYVWEYFTRDQYLSYLETLALARETSVTIGGTTTDKKVAVNGNVYGGSEAGFLQLHTQVTILDNCEIGTTGSNGNVYAGGRGLRGYNAGGRVSGYTNVAIKGGIMHGSVYGGGENGYVKGGVNVNMTGGTVDIDIYGGGALANTNTGNGSEYIAVPGITTGALVSGLYEKEYKAAEGTAQTGVTYYELKDDKYVVKTVTEGASVSGLYVINYKSTTDGTALSGKTYYNNIHPTTVNLLGGHIKGDAYGGGLGQKDGFNGKTGDVAATVWGDINVNLGSNNGSSATAFYLSNYGGDHSSVVKSGRVFGCNNLNGSPRGNVTVTVYMTERSKDSSGNDVDRTAITRNNKGEITDVAPTHVYDLAAVYGGGNLADYAPTVSGKKASVIISSCDVSVHSVYGGGNAAAVPSTDVLVLGAYEIEEVFGGGNGKDPYTTDGITTWVNNPGANVNGNATTLLKGGFIHEAYGGSNSKGTISGNVSIDKSSGGDCPLRVDDLYGAGKDADIEGDLIMVMGCSETRTENIYGCSMNANVKGNVELTITSGEYGKVFGGNNQSGSIFGHIIVNIEEVGCSPIIIDELYLGGNNAAYSVYGYYHAMKYADGDKLFLDAGKTIPLYKYDDKYYKDEAKTIPLYINDNDNKLYLDQEKTRALYMPRTSADNDGNVPVSFPDVNQNTVLTLNSTTGKYSQYADPELNIISCTRIGKVFGGGLGTGASLYGNPSVNINMIPGVKASAMTTNETYNSIHLGEIGAVYGGGYAADVIGSTTVNIGTSQSVNKIVWDSTNDKPVYESDGKTPSTTSETVMGAYITGNVYGGGKGEASLTPSLDSGDAFECAKAMVGKDNDEPTDLNGGTQVNIYKGMVVGNVYGGGEVGRVEKNTVVTIGIGEGVAPGGSTPPTSAPVIKGNVFGAGAGQNTHGYSALVRGNSTVTIQGNAKVEQNVYGGGEAATVGRYRLNNAGLPTEPWGGQYGGGTCTVTIGGYAEIGRDDMKMNNATGGPDDYGHVFGAGMGVLPYEGYADDDKPKHMDGDKVNGVWKDHYKEYGTYATSQGNDNDYINFIKTLGLASNTNVTIKDHAFVKGSVYGGSENGFVQADTHVTIQDDCQIGNGYVQMADDGTYLNKLSTPLTPLAVNRRYTDDEWRDGRLYTTNDRQALKDLVSTTYYKTSLPECASWPYGQAATAADRYAPYDKYYGSTGYSDSKGGRLVGDDGHTFYGNVFGGGSGYYPYRPGKWFKDAGAVYGDTYVTIKGGHILTSVYGGNEMTDVGKYADNNRLNLTSGGNCYVTMIGGTLGVPRTLKQIENHPVTCYLFGAGKGDQRVFFNKSTNVGNVFIHVSDDARIYGSVFGGGEDGHVMKNVTMKIGGNELPTAVSDNSVLTSVFTGVSLSGTKTVSVGGENYQYPYIGTWGTSYVDGNVFGAGRGFGGDAYTAGNVAGSVTMNIYGGTMLGSVYGGGRLGSVGYGLFDASVTDYYGKMRPNNTTETESGSSESLGSFNRGHVDITISGGTIGNKWEFVDVDPSTAPADLATWKANHHVPNTEYEEPEVVTIDNKTSYYYRLKHTKGGNVFAGGMGRQKQIDGQQLIDPEKIDWMKLGNVKQTTLTITGGTIMSNVYGGGELGAVVPYVNGSSVEGGTTQISISGTAAIGTVIERSVTPTVEGESDKVPVYTFGSVFGGGMGNETDQTSSDVEARIGGLVKGSTTITMAGGEVKGSVYGGGEMAVVQGSHTTSDSKTVGTEINISGGKIGYDQEGFGGATMGNVYGGGKGSLTTANAGLIKNNTLVKITGTPTIYHNIYGGGAYGSVGTFTFTTGVPSSWTDNTGKAEVIVERGTIGINGHENGMVFGSSRGDVGTPVAPSQGATPVDPNDRLAWVHDTHVVIGNSSGGPTIKGTLYGSGENGHTFNDTEVIVNDGTIGIASGMDITYTENGKSFTKGGAAYPYRGNVYGGGCGTDTYPTTVTEGEGQSAVTKTIQAFNPLAGIVLGKTEVNINGGTVVRNVYGAGAMGSVGKTNSTGAIINGGITTITISGGQIGVDGTAGDGNVFGAARGDAVSTQAGLSQVRSTSVSMSNGRVWGNIYGGGEAGNVGTYTNTYTETGSKNYIWDKIENLEIGDCSVSMTGGEVKGHVFGAGKGEDNTFECEKAIVRTASVRISNGIVDGNVYGGGEVGRVDQNSLVEIGVGTGEGTFEPTIKGNVFGAGAGKETHGYSALVRGNTEVIVDGNAKVEKSVYGGGEIAAVGRYGLDVHKMPTNLVSGGECKVTIRGKADITNNVFGAGEGVVPHFDKGNADKSKRSRRMTLYTNATDFPANDGIPSPTPTGSIWEYYETGSPFVWEYYQTEEAYLDYLQTLALATDTKVTIDGDAKVKGSVYGGSESGFVQRYTDVKILSGEIGTKTTEGGVTTTTGGNVFGGGLGISENETAGRVRGNTTLTVIGGTMHGSVYGGGALGRTNTEVSNEGVYPTATVNLLGGIIDGDAYGGGLGDASTAADAGNTVVNLNGLHTGTDVDDATLSSLTGENKPLEANGSGYRVKSTSKGVVVGRVFGSNNLNGTPKGNVLVHVHSTQNSKATQIGNTETVTNAKVLGDYDVEAVYGGGNLAAYNPVKSAKDNSDEVKAQAYAEVIIDGCDLTSIKQVYGGGNAASVPATNVAVNGTYEIEEVFGGGNGLDKILKNGNLITNPGANVGFKDYWDYTNEKDLEDYDTKAERQSNEIFLRDYVYGSGKASVEIYGGTVHRVFGGSNTRGNVRETAVTMLQELGGCEFHVDEAYGGGKSAPMDAEAKLLMACIPGLTVAYGGAQDADVQGGVTMTITNGTFDRVFGGNNISGTINGPIVVNIEETGCRPIVIGQLYGGGNQAAYTAPEGGGGPTLNVRSFTSIGEIYGGGYGETAVVEGDTHVNIDVTEGKWASKETTSDEIKEITFSEFKRTSDGGFVLDGNDNRIEETKTITVTIPGHKKDAIGAIGNVFGGGNAAKVDGNTNVNIGIRVKEDVYMAYSVDSGTNLTGSGYYTRSGEGTESSPYIYTEATGTAVDGTTYYKKHQFKGADIRGNIYGGGNNASVTGNTNVVIGKRQE